MRIGLGGGLPRPVNDAQTRVWDVDVSFQKSQVGEGVQVVKTERPGRGTRGVEVQFPRAKPSAPCRKRFLPPWRLEAGGWRSAEED